MTVLWWKSAARGTAISCGLWSPRSGRGDSIRPRFMVSALRSIARLQRWEVQKLRSMVQAWRSLARHQRSQVQRLRSDARRLEVASKGV
jgi:hypothetical protein